MASPSRSGSVARNSELGLLQRAGDGLDVLLVALDDAVLHREVVLGIDRAFLGHQVAHVAIGGQHLEVLARGTS